MVAMNSLATDKGDLRKSKSLDGRTMSMNNQYSKFIDNLPFTHFGTFTTSLELNREGSRKLADQIAAKITTRSLPHNIKMFWVAESFNSREGYHLHCLIYCPLPLHVTKLNLWFRSAYGHCKILSKKGAASRYVAKYIHLPQNDYGII